jgi:hypothetical protein
MTWWVGKGLRVAKTVCLPNVIRFLAGGLVVSVFAILTLNASSQVRGRPRRSARSFPNSRRRSPLASASAYFGAVASFTA